MINQARHGGCRERHKLLHIFILCTYWIVVCCAVKYSFLGRIKICLLALLRSLCPPGYLIPVESTSAEAHFSSRYLGTACSVKIISSAVYVLWWGDVIWIHIHIIFFLNTCI